MFCEMTPPIGLSITRMSPDRWNLGSTMDGGNTFYLRHRTPDDPSEGRDADIDRVYLAGTSAAVWCIGECFFKAHAWCEEMQLESDNIRFVKEKAPEVPVPEVEYGWIDYTVNRHFLITKRVSGQTLDRAWRNFPYLNVRKLLKILRGLLASWLLILHHASKQSLVMEFVNHGFREKLMHHIQPEPPPAIDPVFHFYHADLGPTNVMVMQDGTVSGIIDWESAAYYPQFWVATKTSLPAFHLECETDDPTLWGQLLGQALEVCGYKRLDAEFRRWVKAVT
uniref:Aminoglycoside phosphotransferase domain-containing protein n=1 Tax=Bionectria ochroleuca TaxID=29856 RepID=A0A8H7NLT3_BIOOC